MRLQKGSSSQAVRPTTAVWHCNGLLTNFQKECKRKQMDALSMNRLLSQRPMFPAGSEGLLFLPFLNGERAPFWDPDARGTFFGVSMHHQHAHFARAVMEGVLYSILLRCKRIEAIPWYNRPCPSFRRICSLA
jgi:sugar (pentulose or hexulose) kinase